MPVTSRRSAFILVVARVVPLAALVFAVVLPATSALAQGAVWPNKPVKIVVTFPPGGAPDTLARILADKWGQSLGQTFTVDNKPGAGGNIGADFVAKSAGDGTTLVIGTVGTHAINPALYAVMPYNHVKDFTPVSFLASTPNLLV
ncbi:MAG: tripartite tricarboxylate transporter substrate binding protein, partial [Betaproteobacteria bacterium]|nr:tripartite tricarboxylate transporter substrate binding protein [Betaproteobacteria bacterium]